MDGGIQRIAGSSDAVLQRTGDVATAHSTDACADAPPDEIFNLGIRRPRIAGIARVALRESRSSTEPGSGELEPLAFSSILRTSHSEISEWIQKNISGKGGPREGIWAVGGGDIAGALQH